MVVRRLLPPNHVILLLATGAVSAQLLAQPTLPEGINDEAWEHVIAEVRAAAPQARIIDVGLYPVPADGCPSIFNTELSAEHRELIDRATGPGAADRVYRVPYPFCGLVVTVATNPREVSERYRFVERRGEWVMLDDSM